MLGGVAKPRAPPWRRNPLKGNQMEKDASEDQPTGRLTLGLFVLAELLCTGALIAWVAL
jgi:hypothetical protein